MTDPICAAQACRRGLDLGARDTKSEAQVALGGLLLASILSDDGADEGRHEQTDDGTILAITLQWGLQQGLQETL
jgi:hypothetical protein